MLLPLIRTFGRSEFKGSGLIPSGFFILPLISLVNVAMKSTFEPGTDQFSCMFTIILLSLKISIVFSVSRSGRKIAAAVIQNGPPSAGSINEISLRQAAGN